MLWIILLSKPCRLLTSCIHSFIQQIPECPLYTKPLRYVTHMNIPVLMEQIRSRELPESLRAMLQMDQKDGHKWGAQKPVSAHTHPHPCSSGLPGSSCLGVFLSDGQLLIPAHLCSHATSSVRPLLSPYATHSLPLLLSPIFFITLTSFYHTIQITFNGYSLLTASFLPTAPSESSPVSLVLPILYTFPWVSYLVLSNNDLVPVIC